jgi:DNA-binding GntR family transcriptional regulator
MELDQKLDVASVEDAAYQSLRDAILSSEIAPGGHLHLAALAEQLGVSTMPVRGAIKRLAREGLVQTLPRRGAVASGLSLAELDELYDLRVSLETTVARAAVMQITDAEISVMRSVLAEYSLPQRTDEYQAHEWNAYLAFYRASGRERSVQLILECAQLTERYARYAGESRFDLAIAQVGLERLIKACEQRDSAAAESALLSSLEPMLAKVRAGFLAATQEGQLV